ncbi:ladinin-1 isoform X2 [Emydura macquarii macquarii]|uniref:ladinin-1 isoform X2 n=1 Tax=Emydura macquarii macquarii TaxID=1129001 RepID=UPI00352AC904
MARLARQRTLEDEEEQARERRRRDRSLSSTTDTEDEALCPTQNTKQPALERLQSLEEAEPPAAATAEEETERKLTAVLRPQEVRRQRRQVEGSENLSREKEQPENCREPETGAGSQEATPGWASAHEGKALAEERCQGVAQKSKSPTAEQCPELAAERKVLAGEQRRGPAQEEKDLRAEEPQQDQEVMKGQPRGLAREQKDHSHREVKVLSREGSRIEQKPDSPVTRSSSQQETVRNPPQAQEVAGLPSTQDRPEGSSVASPTRVTYSSSFKCTSPRTISLQDTVRNPPQAQEAAGVPSTQGRPEVSSVASPIHVTYSSSFKRISPRTVSFRVISGKNKEENMLTRSASMRIPASNVKIEEKLEKYTSAVQRSEGVKLPVSVQRGFLPASEGVASKRSIFEASAPNRTDPAPVRKENLRLPGVVTSRINLWISKTQEPSKDGRAKDTEKTDSATKRSIWAKRSDDDSSDTRL